MKNKIILSIINEKGTKQLLIRDITKHLFLVIFTFFLVIFGGAIYGFIKYKEFANIAHDANIKIANENVSLTQNSQILNNKISETLNLIDETKHRMDLLKTELGFEDFSTQHLRLNSTFDVVLEPQKIEQFLSLIPNGSPVNDEMKVIISFGDPTNLIFKKNNGTDLIAKSKIAIIATADGIVEFAGETQNGYKNLVIIRHNFGFETRYANLVKSDVVATGDFIKKGDIIGYGGIDDLMHYEVRYLSRVLNPINFIKWNKTDFNQIMFNERRVPWRLVAALLK